MNKKGIELAISTLILIILGILVLIGLAYFLTNGFKSFNSGTNSLLQTSEGAAVRQACNIACSSGDGQTYCCKNFTISNEHVLCTDSRLRLNCNIDCSGPCR